MKTSNIKLASLALALISTSAILVASSAKAAPLRKPEPAVVRLALAQASSTMSPENPAASLSDKSAVPATSQRLDADGARLFAKLFQNLARAFQPGRLSAISSNGPIVNPPKTLAFAPGRLAAQEAPFCHSYEHLQQSLRDDPTLQRRMDEQYAAIKNYAETVLHAPGRKGTTPSSSFIIPVVVYIVHQNGPENICNDKVISQIDTLNALFAPVGITFCLATQYVTGNGTVVPFPLTPDPCNTSLFRGVFRIASPLTDVCTIGNGANCQENESLLKALTDPTAPNVPILPAQKYLRIWVVRGIDGHTNPEGGVVGIGTFPGTNASLDGIIMRYDVFGNPGILQNHDQGKTLAHEVGHYLYLYHPFDGGCPASTPYPYQLSDPPQEPTHNQGCPIPNHTYLSCNGGLDSLDNHMDYWDDPCRTTFSQPQIDVMLSTIGVPRPELVSNQNLVFTGVGCTNGLNAAFLADNYNPCANTTLVTFTGATTNPSGTIYSWDFGDGSPVVNGTVTMATHTFSTPGTYTVSLTVTSGTNSLSSTEQIFVTNCTLTNPSQGNWYFGLNAALSFSTGTPVAVLDSAMQAEEGCVTQSDPSGHLLFYSDGVDIWDSSHVKINTIPLGGDPSTAQSALSVPDPADPNRFYLFTLGPAFGNAKLYYTLVTVASGTITLGTTTEVLTTGGGHYQLAEQLTAVPNCAGNGYWVIVHDAVDTTRLLSFPLLATGIGTPVASSGGPCSVFGTAKASPDGSMIAMAAGQCSPPAATAATIYDFDRATGVISNPRYLDHGDFGCSFSPDSKLFYAASYITGNLYQYDAKVANPNATTKFLGTLNPPSNGGTSTLQLGPDGKIYGVNNHVTRLSVINFPNVPCTPSAPNDCGFTPNGPDLGGRHTISGSLPNMIDALPANQVVPDFTYAVSSCNTVTFSTNVCSGPYSWDFGDGSNSNVRNPTHIFDVSGGDRTVTLTVMVNGVSVVVHHMVTLGLGPVQIAGPTEVSLPTSNPTNYSPNTLGNPNLTYNWTVSGTGNTFSVGASGSIDVVWTTLPATVCLTITDTTTGCSASNCITVIPSTATPTPTPTPAAPALGFVIGDLNAVVGNHVMFWGAQWWKHNSLSGGPAPASFKGFANSPNPNPPACGGTWQSDPGNSSGPPHSVPAYIKVIVSSSITKSGSTISGNVPEMVIVHTDPGYDGNPGHAGTGTVTAVVCP